MILNNAKQMIKNLSAMGGISCTGIINEYVNCFPYVNYNGETVSTINKSYYGSTKSLAFKVFDVSNTMQLVTSITKKYDSKSSLLYLGTGTTTPTLSDYAMENLITSGLTILAQNKLELITVDVESYTVTRTVDIELQIKNTSSNTITISEIGFAQPFPTNNSENTIYPTLLYREVLDEPLTIEASGVGTIIRQIVIATSVA